MCKMKFLGTLLMLFFLVGCNNNVKEIIFKAEEMMQNNPDSSLAILQTLDSRKINHREYQARYALLYSQALDKNYIDVTNDSLINVAVSYYSTRNNPKYTFLSYYYNGRVLSNANKFHDAILSYTKAEELVEQIEDYRSVGLLYGHLSGIYKRVYDLSKSLDASKKAYDSFSKAGDSLLKHYTMIDIGHLYLDMKKFDLAEKYLLEAMTWIYDNKPKKCASCVKLLIDLYEETGNDDALNDLLRSKYFEICDEDILEFDMALAYVYAKKGDINKSQRYLSSAWEKTKKFDDTLQMYFKEYQIQKCLHNYKESLSKYETLILLSDVPLRKTLQQPIISVQKDYYKAQSDYKSLKLRYNKHVWICMILLFITVLVVLYLYFKYRILLKDNEINGYINLSRDLQISSAKIEEGMRIQINDLFAKQYELLDRLSCTYYETKGVKIDKEAIYKEVKKEIDLLTSDNKCISQLENIINKYKDNVRRRLRDEVNNLH